MIRAVRISSNQFGGTSPKTHFSFTLHLMSLFSFIPRKSWRSTVSSRLDNGPLAWFRALVLTDLLLVLFFGREDALWKCTIVKNGVSYISTKRRVKSLNESTDSIYHFCWIVNITSLKFYQQLNSRLHNLFEGNKTSLQREVMLLEKGVLLLQENLYMYCAFYLPKANLFCSRWRVSPY